MNNTLSIPFYPRCILFLSSNVWSNLLRAQLTLVSDPKYTTIFKNKLDNDDNDNDNNNDNNNNNNTTTHNKENHIDSPIICHHAFELGEFSSSKTFHPNMSWFPRNDGGNPQVNPSPTRIVASGRLRWLRVVRRCLAPTELEYVHRFSTDFTMEFPGIHHGKLSHSFLGSNFFEYIASI